MLLWRLATAPFASRFDGGYGLVCDGRWNRRGHPVTYAATSPALCILEKLVHIEDPSLLPALIFVCYRVPPAVRREQITLPELSLHWTRTPEQTQALGMVWLTGRTAAVLEVPSAIVPLAGAPDRNVLINHAHADAAMIQIDRLEPFTLDHRLL